MAYGVKRPPGQIASLIKHRADMYSSAVAYGEYGDLERVRIKHTFHNTSWLSKQLKFRETNKKAIVKKGILRVFKTRDELEMTKERTDVNDGGGNHSYHIDQNETKSVSATNIVDKAKKWGTKRTTPNLSISTQIDLKEKDLYRIHIPAKGRSCGVSPAASKSLSSSRKVGLKMDKNDVKLGSGKVHSKNLSRIPSFHQKSVSMGKLQAFSDTSRKSQPKNSSTSTNNYKSQSILTSFFLSKTKSNPKSSKLRSSSLGLISTVGNKNHRAKPKKKHICFKSALPSLDDIDEDEEQSEGKAYCEIADIDLKKIMPGPITTKYMNKNNYVGMVNDSLLMAVKKYDKDIRKEEENKNNINKRFMKLNWQYSQEREGYKFIRKCFKTKHMNQANWEINDYMPKTEMELQADEERQRVIVHRKMRELEEKNKNEQIMFDALGSMVNIMFRDYVPPAKRLQQILFEHRYKLKIVRVFNHWKEMEKDDVMRGGFDRRIQDYETKVQSRRMESLQFTNKSMIKDTMNSIQENVKSTEGVLGRNISEVHLHLYKKPSKTAIKCHSREISMVEKNSNLVKNVQEIQIKNLSGELSSIFDIVKNHNRINRRQKSLSRNSPKSSKSPYET